MNDICPSCHKVFDIDTNAGRCVHCGADVPPAPPAADAEPAAVDPEPAAAPAQPPQATEEIDSRLQLELARFELGVQGKIIADRTAELEAAKAKIAELSNPPAPIAQATYPVEVNPFLVGIHENTIFIGALGRVRPAMSRNDALNLAAWIGRLAEEVPAQDGDPSMVDCWNAVSRLVKPPA